MSEIKNVGYTWMALNTFKCNHLMPLRFKLLTGHFGVIPGYETYVIVDATRRISAETIDASLADMQNSGE